MRLAVLTNKPTHYRVPLFARIAEAEGVEAKFFFDGTSQGERVCAPGVPSEHLAALLGIPRSGQRGEEMESLRLGWSYLPRLAAFRPDVVVSGEFGWRTLHAAAYAALAGIPLLVWWEGTPFTDRHVGAIRLGLRRFLSRRASGLLGFGSGGVESLRRLAPAGADVQRVPQAIDHDRFGRSSDSWRADRDALRGSLGVQGTVLLCVGRLVRRKGIAELLEALQRFRAANPSASYEVLLIGDGPLREQAERAATRLDGTLRVLGPVSPDDLPRYFAAADALLFPTLLDCWGMVVNEALAAGLPVLGSRYSAAVDELITRDALGCRFDPLDPGSFDAVLHAAIVEGRFRGTSIAETRRALAPHSIDAAAEAILAASRRALRREGSPCPT